MRQKSNKKSRAGGEVGGLQPLRGGLSPLSKLHSLQEMVFSELWVSISRTRNLNFSAPTSPTNKFLNRKATCTQLEILTRNVLIRNVGADVRMSWPGNCDPQLPKRPFLGGNDLAGWKGGAPRAPPAYVTALPFGILSSVQ